jgi:hypothetical protein
MAAVTLLPSHGRGRWFEPSIAHSECPANAGKLEAPILRRARLCRAIARAPSVLVPPAVIEELVVLPGEPASELPAEDWLERRAPRVETLLRVESEMTEGRGEKHAIALALELSALVVLDDK